MGQTRDAAGAGSSSARVAFVVRVLARLLVGFGLVALSACFDEGKQSGPPKTVKVLVDITKSTPPPLLQQYFDFVRDVIGRLQAQDRIQVFAITDAGFSRPQLLLKGTIPTDDRDLHPHILAARESLVKQWYAVVDTLTPRYNITDVFGTIAYASEIFKGEAGVKRLYVLSDCRNSTSALNLEDMDVIDVEQAMNRLADAGLICDLRDVNLVFGLHTSSKDVRYHESMVRFLRAYADTTRANLVDIRVDLNFSTW